MKKGHEKVNIEVRPADMGSYIKAILESHGFRMVGASYGIDHNNRQIREMDFEFEERDIDPYNPDLIKVNTPWEK